MALYYFYDFILYDISGKRPDGPSFDHGLPVLSHLYLIKIPFAYSNRHVPSR